MRFTITTTPVHTDKNATACSHPRPGAKPCPGTSGYRARCSGCSWRRTARTTGPLAVLADAHLASHLTAPAAALA
jgi:hypothetical protein